REIQSKVQYRSGPLTVANRPFVQSGNHPIPILIDILPVARAYRPIPLPVVVSRPVRNFLPALALAVCFKSPIQVTVPLNKRIPVFVPRIAEARFVTIPIVETRVCHIPSQ